MGPLCPYCSRELHSARQRECAGCGKPVDPKALEAVQDAMRGVPGSPHVTATQAAIAWGSFINLVDEIPSYRFEPGHAPDRHDDDFDGTPPPHGTPYFIDRLESEPVYSTPHYLNDLVKQPPREVEYEDVTRKQLPAPSSD